MVDSLEKNFLRPLFLIVAAYIVASTSSIFLKYARTRVAQFRSGWAMQVTCIKEEYNSFRALPARALAITSSIR